MPVEFATTCLTLYEWFETNTSGSIYGIGKICTVAIEATLTLILIAAVVLDVFAVVTSVTVVAKIGLGEKSTKRCASVKVFSVLNEENEFGGINGTSVNDHVRSTHFQDFDLVTS